MYRIICPQNNWQHPIQVDQKGLDLVKEIAGRLKLVTNYDTQQQKLYIGPPLAETAELPISYQVAQAIGASDLYQEVVIEDILKATVGWPLTHRAYVIATAWHESRLGQYMTELSSGTQYEGRKDLGNNRAGDGARFKGRGYVQITGRVNYRRFGKMLKKPLDLELYPELAARRSIALEILLIGMNQGAFTGFGLSDYDRSGPGYDFDFVNARRIVNGLDKAEEIADIARRVLDVLQQKGFAGG